MIMNFQNNEIDTQTDDQKSNPKDVAIKSNKKKKTAGSYANVIKLRHSKRKPLRLFS